MKKKIEFGLKGAEAFVKNYQTILDKLLKGYEKVTGKVAEGLDFLKIKQEARQRAEEASKVVDMEGKTLDPSKPIMGGTQQVEKTSRKLTDEEYGELVDEYGEGVPLGIETVEDAQKFVKSQKDYEAEMFQEYKMGKLDPKRGEPNRRRFLEKKADEGQLSRSEAEELADMDFGENLKKIYDEAKGPGKGDEMVEALKSPGAIKSSEIIEAQLKETFPDIKLFGDETFEELLEIQRTGKHPRMKADGGRINFALGGPTNIIGAGLADPSLLGAGMPMEEEDEFADIRGQTAGLGVLSFLTKTLGPKVGTYVFDRARDKIVSGGIDAATRAAQARRQAAEAAAALVTAQAAVNRREGTGGYQSDFAQDTDFMSGKGTAAEMGSFAYGGLASMFTEKR